MYTSLAAFKQYINDHNDDDALNHTYLDAAETIVENYLGYSPVYRPYTSILSGKGSTTLHLKAKPIHAILEVIIDGRSVPAPEFTPAGDSIYSHIPFPWGDRNVAVSYYAGYDPETAPSSPGGDDDDGIIDGGDAFSTYADDESESPGALIIPPMPRLITMTVLRIAALIHAEADGNIGVTGKNFGESGGRTFINTINFDKYLIPLSKYKLMSI
ncbi:MAG: phage gp6-like head-tail connector protein [Treponema sp.]|jgi:hypothetical protein|nr:phage gp6-like head-tail connector protein [Treponema sp.]